MIHFRVSGEVKILTPTRNGQVVISYAPYGRTEIVDAAGLWADGGIKELSAALAAHNDAWNYANWLDPDKWHNGAHKN